MLNFRKLKQDFSPAVLKEGRVLFEKKTIVSAKIVNLKQNTVRLSCRVVGNFDHCYQSEIEIDRHHSATIDSDCDCSHKYDCQHLAAVIYYLEENLNEILVNFSKETDIEKTGTIDAEEKKELQAAIKEAETKEVVRRGKKIQKELLSEYIEAARVFGQSPFFMAEEDHTQDQAELAIVFAPMQQQGNAALDTMEFQLALRLPFRSKPLNILNIKEFFDCIRYREALYLGNKRYFFGMSSFDDYSGQVLKMLIDFAYFPDSSATQERNMRIGRIGMEAFGTILAHAYDLANAANAAQIKRGRESEGLAMPCFYSENLEQPLRFSPIPAGICFEIEHLDAGASKLFLKPKLLLDGGNNTPLQDAFLFECAKPGMLHHNTFYRFQPKIKRKHLRHLPIIRDMTVPEPLFGTFIENALPELQRYAEVANREVIEKFVTLPYVGDLKAICDIQYLNGELEASLQFLYEETAIPAAASQISADSIASFVTKQGILARNLTEEQKIIEDLFQDFTYDPGQGLFISKHEKKIVEFMTEVIPRNQHRVTFNCPENLLDQFVYDETTFTMSLRESKCIDTYEVDLEVNGHLKGVTVDQLWECLATKRSYIELVHKEAGKKKGVNSKMHKILVLDLDRLAPVVQLFDEIGLKMLDNHKEERPLWSLASITAAQFEGLPIKFKMTDRLFEIQQQMLGNRPTKASPVPKVINATLRSYQEEGVHWLERLRTMHLNGILADDMGLGKTLQAIIAITQQIDANPQSISIIVCPTSLVYNWKEEFGKFNPKLKVLPVDGTPAQRKKLFSDISKYHIVITSYNLLQKDIEFYKTIPFAYAILDEAQHIKNRGTRNAKSVKMIHARHRLILTGTPIENSLDELWSLFDYLMPGLLSSYDRFVEKYIRNPNYGNGKNLEALKHKVSPFIMRRMKADVLQDLPPITEIVYHCHLSETQGELYRSYANSAREELVQLVHKEGFDKVQIHVLATLTRLKQICCHPAIFAKDKAETGDSAKYDMLLELVQSLIEGGHKAVIFSQYTRMLNIMREEMEQMGIRFSYLDGTSKNRLNIVKEFNSDPTISVFLVSLKAGGSGLNLTGADTVIHYDMWWNPAVENQATDRVHRIGQNSSISSYKLVTLGTIEEKILEMQNRKRGLVKKVVSSDEEAIAKLTWEEVLELLQT
jgi:SNF2 family DNA or RNA helicase